MKIRLEKKKEDPTLYIYGAIGSDWFGDGITDTMVAEAMADIPDSVKSLTLRINSPGGDAFQGLAIYNLLSQHRLKINAIVDGLAASAASVILMAADTRQIAENALVMIHEAAGSTIGNKGDHAKSMEVLGKLDDVLAKTYAARTGKKQDEMMRMMEEETWMDAKEATKMGFADSIIAAKEEDVAEFDGALFAKFAAHYKNPPLIIKTSDRATRGVIIVARDDQPLPEDLKRRLDLLKVSA